MSDDERLLPVQAVEHGDRIVYRLGDRERSVERRRFEAALLVGGDPEFRGELLPEFVDVLEAQPGTAVQEQQGRSGAGEPALDRAAGHGKGECVAPTHARYGRRVEERL